MSAHSLTTRPAPQVPTLRAAIVVLLLMGAAALAAWLLTPRMQPAVDVPNLEATVPKKFGEWKTVQAPYGLIDVEAAEPGGGSVDRPYDQSLLRAYSNARGQVVMLALAFGANQRQEVKIHWPELCYAAQGFSILSSETASLPVRDQRRTSVPGHRMLAASPDAIEAVSYWIRIGSEFTDSAWSARSRIFKDGLRGRAIDGVLVRASARVQSTAEAPAAHVLVEAFLLDFVNALDKPTKSLVLDAAADVDVK